MENESVILPLAVHALGLHINMFLISRVVLILKNSGSSPEGVENTAVMNVIPAVDIVLTMLRASEKSSGILNAVAGGNLLILHLNFLKDLKDFVLTGPYYKIDNLPQVADLIVCKNRPVLNKAYGGRSYREYHRLR